jgi:hypothetical protein
MTWGAFYGDAPEHYTQWIDVCLASNPKMIFLIQDGWPTFDPEWKEADSKVVLEQLDAAQRDIQQGMFKQLFRELDQGYPEKVHVIPAGAAVVQMIHHYYDGKTPELDCVSEHLGGSHGILKDGGHLSKASGMDWLLGYVYYGMLYHRSPQLIEGFQPPDVSAKFDTLMRDAAWKAVISSPYSGIQDSDRDGVGELVELEAN